jgi:hypothetical protein
MAQNSLGGEDRKATTPPQAGKACLRDAARLPDLDAPNIPTGIGPNLERTNRSGDVEERVKDGANGICV